MGHLVAPEHPRHAGYPPMRKSPQPCFPPANCQYTVSGEFSQPFSSQLKCVILRIQNSGSQRSGGSAMTFDEILAQIIDLLKRQGRVSYSALKRRFDLDDEHLDVLKEELIDAQRIATDEDGRILVWTGQAEGVPLSASQSLQVEQ